MHRDKWIRRVEIGPRFIRLQDALDRPLYRIFPLWAFDDMLRSKRLVLVPPHYWEDPFEDVPARVFMHGDKDQKKFLSKYLCSAFCQCWSFESDSDSLLRAYSRVTIDRLYGRNSDPRNEGVQVQTSVRKLVAALGPWVSRCDWGQIVIGRVDYLEQDDLVQKVFEVLGTVGPYELGRGSHRAQSLLLKRRAFAHEDEVRLIFVAKDQRNTLRPLPIDVDPGAFIDNVRFDPRLVDFERKERQDHARSLGYKGPFSDSLLYQTAVFQAMVPWNWAHWGPDRAPFKSSDALN